MKRAFRLLSVSLLLVVALGMVISASAQELMKVESPDCDYAGGANAFKSIEAVDALTVKFTLCKPDPAFPAKIAFSAFGIQSSDYLTATGGTGDLLNKPIGTGPYMLDSWDLGNEMVLKANPNYWGDKAKEESLIIRWNAESAARVTELQSGTVDGIDNPGAADMEVIEADSNLALYPRPGSNVFYIGMNNTYPPFDKVEVRQAIAYAIDRQRIVDNFYPTGSIEATQFIPPIIFGFTKEVGQLDAGMTHDEKIAKAKELLAAAGYPDGFEVTVNFRDVVRGYLPDPKVVSADIQAQLAEVGIKVNIEVMESGAFLDAASAGQLPFFLLGWGADYPDATNFLDFHFGAGANDSFGTKIPELVDTLSQAASLADPDARYALYIKANEIVRDQVPMLAVAHGGSAAAFQARIAGAYSSSIGAEQFALMEDPDDDNIVWMQNAEPISLFCGDETDGETLRACEQINESLLRYEVGTGNPIASLATEYSANEDLTEWTFKLRDGVTFHDGSTFDANDVVATFDLQWDAASPLHVGRQGSFDYFSGLFGAFLNAPATTE